MACTWSKYFLLKSHLCVVLQLMKTVCQNLRRKPRCALSSAINTAMPSSPEFVTSPDPEKKATPKGATSPAS